MDRNPEDNDLPELPARIPHQYQRGTSPYTIYDQTVANQPTNGGFPAPKITDVDSTAGSTGYDNAPAHYQGKGGIQVFDVWDAYDMDRYRATAFKYFARYKRKGSEANDLNKLVHYLDESILRLPAETEDYLNMDDIELKPAQVLPAFELEGIMGDAALDFLLSFTTKHPKTYLRAAKAQVEDYLMGM